MFNFRLVGGMWILVLALFSFGSYAQDSKPVEAPIAQAAPVVEPQKEVSQTPVVAEADRTSMQLLWTKLQLAQATVKNIQADYDKALKDLSENYAKNADALHRLEEKAYKDVDRNKWILDYEKAAFVEKPASPPVGTK